MRRAEGRRIVFELQKKEKKLMAILRRIGTVKSVYNGHT